MSENRYPKFSVMLRRRMDYQGLTSRVMANALGCNRASVTQWRGGLRLPEARFLAGIADLLDAPALVFIAAEYRTGRCDECGKPYVMQAKAGHPQRFCDRTCKNTYNTRIRRKSSATKRSELATARLRQQAAEAARDKARRERNDLLDDVMTYCNWCEPEGLCRDAGCTWRRHSPLPMLRKETA